MSCLTLFGIAGLGSWKSNTDFLPQPLDFYGIPEGVGPVAAYKMPQMPEEALKSLEDPLEVPPVEVYLSLD